MEIRSELKNLHMTDEYAAKYLMKQGYILARVDLMEQDRFAKWAEEDDNGD